MILRYISDIHLEFIKPNKIQKFIQKIKPNPDQDEVCILAGDIGYPYSQNYSIFMEYINNSFKKTFVIPGNHEFYKSNKTIEETNEHLTEYFKKFDKISFLNNNYEHYENHCFVGSTLWSKITDPLYEINDVYSIKGLDLIKYNELNKTCINFLENAVQKNDNIVLITHHMPSKSLIHSKYMTPTMKPYNQWFYSDMDPFIEKHKDKIKCWIYGHTHTPSICKIHNIPFLCNPIGYPNENNNSDFNKIFEL
jgi:predicted phosphodiesterase